MSTPNKILHNFIDTKLNGEFINFDTDVIEIARHAEETNKLLLFKKDQYFCMYKTKFDNSDSILILFTLNLPGPSTGSSIASTIVMDIIKLIENVLYPIDNIKFNRLIGNSTKSIAILMFTKKIREDDRL